MSLLKRAISKAITRPGNNNTQQRFYKAASPSPYSGRSPSMSVPPDYIIFTELRRLRAKARDLYQNAAHIKRFVQMMKVNVVGPHGVSLAPYVLAPSGTLDTVVNQTLTDQFEIFCRQENCTVLGNLDWHELQRLAVGTLVTDGEFFCVMHRDADINDCGFSLELIDPEQLDSQYRAIVPGGYVEASIEYDNVTNKPVAYWITQIPQGGPPSYSYYAGKKIRFPAEQVLHLYQPETVGMRRGLPWTSTAADTVAMLDAWAETSLVGARIAASQMGLIQTPGGADYQGDHGDEAGNVSYEVEPGMIKQLPIGTTFTQFDPKQPTTAYPEFEKCGLRKIASGLGVSYNSLASDSENFSYASGRVFIAEERTQYKIVQDLLINRLLRPIYLNWLQAQLLQGSISIPGKANQPYMLKFSDFDKYCACKFTPAGFAPLDETKTSNANVTAILQGLKSRSEIIREAGHDPLKVWQEIEQEKQLIASLGLIFADKDTSVTEKIAVAE